MGCVASRIDKEERVRICKERKMLMKQIVGFRREFADSQLRYLRSLKNTGVTLRQFTESESLELENTRFGLALPPSPPPPLPPPPPPPPNFSPDLRKDKGKQRVEVAQEEIIEIDEDNNCTPPPPPLASSTWDFWDPFAPSSPHCEKKSEIEEPIEEENWAETKSQFEEEEQEGVVGNNSVNMLPEKPLNVELLDDNSSMMSWHTKDTASADMAMMVWRRKKTLAGIVKELDDYFLKASDGGKDIVILMDINSSDTFLRQNPKEMSRSMTSVLILLQEWLLATLVVALRITSFALGLRGLLTVLIQCYYLMPADVVLLRILDDYWWNNSVYETEQEINVFRAQPSPFSMKITKLGFSGVSTKRIFAKEVKEPSSHT
ncbi:hypothetical protein RHSIM_Rhsim07G0193600 [Rhododendron simsii]|uniref:DUF630 domain-containing protein n=1 Tax=Rhododendron simsii TaxID=118357 RepID=A0A834LJA4_RHOSS|nr:hypothetical protein RHSIM_Rhsim07G0193600 [Rhododendron simsii]